MNGFKLAGNSDYLQYFFSLLQKSPLWANLMYSLSESTKNSMEILLKCDLFNPILANMKHVENLRYLSRIELVFEYWSPDNFVHAEDLFEKMQYLLTSFILNAEFKYPFVFSYFGRKIFRINYATNLRTVSLFSTPLDCLLEPDKHRVLKLVLQKLQAAILYEFNTLNVMKECDLKSHRAAACRKYMATAKKNPMTFVKSTAYDLRVVQPDEWGCK